MAGFQDVDRQRLVGLAVLPPLDDGENAITVLREAVSLGLRGAFLPVRDGGLPLSSPANEPFWHAAEELRVPISFHAGASKRTQVQITDTAGVPGWNESFLSMLKFDVGNYIALFIFGGVLDRHPGLRIVIAESGIGWIPYLLESMESVYEKHRHYMKTPLSRHPTEVFHKHFHATFQEDLAGLRLRDALGVGNIMWASDYPHTDTTWPHSREVIERYFKDVPTQERERIVLQNCVELYGLS
jgi:predicted TIM-barrel fold metal-dependent hydrolase